MPYLGVDGGGTKTEFILVDKRGNILSYLKEASIDYKRIGRNSFQKTIKKSMDEITNDSDINLDEIQYSFWGIPCYGDELSKKEEKDIDQIIKENLESTNYMLGNDVEAGWAGSLACKPGINLVAGTGAIGFGKDTQGNKARASGWGHCIGDEGSAYWLGEKLLNYFTKQSDGRMEKTPLYSLVKQHLSIEDDFEIINLITAQNDFDRKEIANLALIVHKAALKGDHIALKAYKEAAYELSLIVIAIENKLNFNEKIIDITYSGGVFNAGKLILKPLEKYIDKYNINLKKPLLKPVTGAALYAMILDSNIKLTEKLINKLKKEEGDVFIDDRK
jgi:N-acetylglucosamine kinase-like BadF-type ATPase